jgi:hypothetical protein
MGDWGEVLDLKTNLSGNTSEIVALEDSWWWNAQPLTPHIARISNSQVGSALCADIVWSSNAFSIREFPLLKALPCQHVDYHESILKILYNKNRVRQCGCRGSSLFIFWTIIVQVIGILVGGLILVIDACGHEVIK